MFKRKLTLEEAKKLKEKEERFCSEDATLSEMYSELFDSYKNMTVRDIAKHIALFVGISSAFVPVFHYASQKRHKRLNKIIRELESEQKKSSK